MCWFDLSNFILVGAPNKLPFVFDFVFQYYANNVTNNKLFFPLWHNTIVQGVIYTTTAIQSNLGNTNANIVSLNNQLGSVAQGLQNSISIVEGNVYNLSVATLGTQDSVASQIVKSGVLPQKPGHWATNWVVGDNEATPSAKLDIYCSADGRILATASAPMRFSSNYGATWSSSGDIVCLFDWACSTQSK